jgi:hypothetical protein
MKRTILVLAASAVLFPTTSCDKQLSEINANPNATENPQPAYLLTGVLKQGADLYWGLNSSFGSTLLFVQHWAKIQYAEADRFEFSNTADAMTALWNTSYATLITDLNTILDFPEETAGAAYKGIALTLRSWVFLLLTDAYGDVPYRQAGRSLVPAYDSQRDIYLGLLDELTQAAGLLDGADETVSGDVVYGGDLVRWQRFANSLKLRIALRIADREEDVARQTVAALPLDGLIASNDDNFVFTYTNSPQHNPQSAAFDTRDDYRISATIVGVLTELDDPRLPVYAQHPADFPDTYVGAANGLSNGDAAAQGFSRTSLPGLYFLAPTAPAVIYTRAEVLFNLAEAAARHFIEGDPADYYRQAVAASLRQFAVPETSVEAYLQQPAVAYDPTDFRRAIGLQKWIAFFGQGLDAFAEWRRLDAPRLVAGPATVLEGHIPLRFFYPGPEQSLNAVSYRAAVKHQGADLLTTPLWFDVAQP